MAVDEYTKLLLHCDGTDASTTFTDNATGKAITAVDNAQIDTAQKQFGTGSALFDGNTDYIYAGDSADWYFATGDFTVDWWVRFNSVATAIMWGDVVNTSNYLLCYWAGNNLYLSLVEASSETIGVVKAWTPSPDTWYHVAVVRTGNNFMMFVDGTQIGTTVTDTDDIPDFAGIFVVGGWAGNTTQTLNGWIDEFRVSKGIARWTEDFTPPDAPYEGSSPSASESPSLSPSASESPSISPSVSPSISPSASPSISPSSSVSPSNSPSLSPSASLSPSSSVSPSASLSPSRSESASASPSPSPESTRHIRRTIVIVRSKT